MTLFLNFLSLIFKTDAQLTLVLAPAFKVADSIIPSGSFNLI